MPRRVRGNSSGKYDYNNRSLDDDIQNKIKVQNQFKSDLIDLIKSDYRYHLDDGPMSLEAKTDILRSVLVEILEIRRCD